MNAIELKDVCKTYAQFSLDHLNLSLPSGCIMGLIGENGAGKSTTMKLILGMIKKDGGTVRILGQDADKELYALKEEIGIVLDETGIPSCLNARQVGKIMQCTYRRWDMAAYNDFLQRLAVPETKKFKEFSRGMKMKLGIAIALSHHPKLLILDEATSGLDPVVRDELLDVFLDFTREEEHSILISSHIVSDLEKICDYVAFLHRGKLILCEEKDRLKEQYAVIRCTKEELAEFQKAVIGKRESEYGVEAIALRSEIPAGIETSPVDLEQLFVFMVKGERV